MDLADNNKIATLDALAQKEAAMQEARDLRKLVAEQETEIMMLRSVVKYFRVNVICDYTHLQVYDEMDRMTKDALDWTAGDGLPG